MLEKCVGQEITVVLRYLEIYVNVVESMRVLGVFKDGI
jgi:hypothetical protein